MAVGMLWAATTHRGRVRRANEDAILAGPRIFAVADGVGGAAGGRLASSLVIAELMKAERLGPLDETSIRRAVAEANDLVFNHPEYGSMGTTLAGLAIADDEECVVMFNIGDSRVYRLRDGEFDQLSTDHSLVAEMVRTGALHRSDAATHPDRSVITRAIGAGSKAEVDLLRLTPEVGDRFLICSDGLTTELSDARIAQLSARRVAASAAVQDLLERTLDAGARDNVSIVIADVIDGHAVAVRDAETHRRTGVLSSVAVG